MPDLTEIDATPRPPSGPSEQQAFNSAWAEGRAFGARYSNMWAPWPHFLNEAGVALQPHVAAIASGAVRKTRASRWAFWIAWALGISLLVAILMFFVAAAEGVYDAGGWALLSLALWIGWLLAMIKWLRLKQEREAFVKDWLEHVAWLSAAEELARRQDQARAHQPGTNRRAPRTPAPAPQPFGVSHQGAEQLVAQWMSHLGETDAEATQFTGDGGIDVVSSHYIAQVKNYTGIVGVAEIRELAGIAAVDGRKPLFFTSGTYAGGSVEFANRAGIALFIYDAVEGTIVAADPIAQAALQRGL